MLVLLCSLLAHAQFTPYYTMEIADDVRLGGTLNEELTDIILTADNEYVVSGISHSSSWENYITLNYGLEDIWLVGLNQELDIVSSTIHGSAGNERVFSMVQCADGSIAMCGYIQGGAPPHIFNGTETLELNGDFDLLLMKVDAEGDLLWVKNFGGSEKEFGYDLVELQNGDLLVSGFTESVDGDVSNNKGKEDVWLLRVNTGGELVWEKTFGGSNDDKARSMILKDNDIGENDDVWILGSSKSSDVDVSENFGTLDFWLVSIDIASGNINWEQSYGGNNGDVGIKMVGTDSGAILCGQSASLSAFGTPYGADDVVLMTVDEVGEKNWSTHIGGSSTDLLSDFVATDFYLEGDIGLESVIYLTGYSFSNDADFEPFGFSLQEENAWVVAFDMDNKRIINAGLFGGNDEDQMVGLVLPDESETFNTVICAGFTKSIDGDLGKHGAHDGWVTRIIKPNSIGIEDEIQGRVNIAPNPVQNVLRFDTSFESFTYQLFDLTGKVRFRSQKNHSLFGSQLLDFSAMTSGIYFLEVCDETNCIREKVVKQ